MVDEEHTSSAAPVDAAAVNQRDGDLPDSLGVEVVSDVEQEVSKEELGAVKTELRESIQDALDNMNSILLNVKNGWGWGGFHEFAEKLSTLQAEYARLFSQPSPLLDYLHKTVIYRRHPHIEDTLSVVSSEVFLLNYGSDWNGADSYNDPMCGAPIGAIFHDTNLTAEQKQIALQRSNNLDGLNTIPLLDVLQIVESDSIERQKRILKQYVQDMPVEMRADSFAVLNEHVGSGAVRALLVELSSLETFESGLSFEEMSSYIGDWNTLDTTYVHALLKRFPASCVLETNLAYDTQIGVLVSLWFSRDKKDEFCTLSPGVKADMCRYMTERQFGHLSIENFKCHALSVESLDTLDSLFPGGLDNEIFVSILLYKPLNSIRQEWSGIRQGIPMKQIFVRKIKEKKIHFVMSAGSQYSSFYRSDLYRMALSDVINDLSADQLKSLKLEDIVSTLTDFEQVQAIVQSASDERIARSLTLDSIEKYIQNPDRFLAIIKYVSLKEVIVYGKLSHEQLLQVAIARPVEELLEVKEHFSIEEMRQVLMHKDPAMVSKGASLLNVLPYDLSSEFLFSMAKSRPLTEVFQSDIQLSRMQRLEIAMTKSAYEVWAEKERFSLEEIRQILIQKRPAEVANAIESLLYLLKYDFPIHFLFEIAKSRPLGEVFQVKEEMFFTPEQMFDIASVRPALEIISFSVNFGAEKTASLLHSKSDAELATLSFEVLVRHMKHERILRMLSGRSVADLFSYRDRCTDAKFNEVCSRRIRDVLLYLKQAVDVNSEGDDKKTDAVVSMYKKLLSVQPPTTNEAHCAIKSDIQPLIKILIDKQIIFAEDTRVDADWQQVLEFIQTFGAINMPTVAEIMVRARRGELYSSLGDNVQLRTAITDLLGDNYLRKPKSDTEILNDIKKAKIALQSDILHDVSNKVLLSDVGIEIVNAVRRSTSFERNFDMKEMIGTVFDAQSKRPESRLAPGYESQTIEVKTRVAKELDEAKTKELDEKKKFWYQHASVYARELSQVVQRAQSADISQSISDLHYQVQDMVRERVSALEHKMGSVPEKIQAGMKKQIEKLQAAESKLLRISAPASLDDAGYASLLDALCSLGAIDKDIDTEISKMIKTVSLRHALAVAPDGYVQMLTQFQNTTPLENSVGRDVIQQGADFFINYFSEHYLHTSQDVTHTDHAPFQKESVKRLRNIWQLKETDLGEHPFAKAESELVKIDRRLQGVGEPKPLTFVPAKGLLRVIAGNIGDACYTSKAKELAAGEYPGITAVAMVSNYGTSQESLDGSVLFVETTTESGDPVLVVRANNPRMSMFDKFDADDLISTVLTYAKQTATKRNISQVMVVRDNASAACSNRGEVAQYYQKQFQNKKPVQLKNGPETNFNGYNIYNAAGSHPVVSIH